jgi:hypothetical protein
MNWFSHCKTIDEVKSLYKKLAKENHPDRGGDTATMQAINREYAFACAHIVKGSGLSEEQTETEIRVSEEYRRVIEQLMPLLGITIELVGLWLWVTGNTYPVRRELKAAGLFFASKKQAWYYRSEQYKTRGNGEPLEKIRARYGSETVSRRKETNTIED